MVDDSPRTSSPQQASLDAECEGERLVVRLAGDWLLGAARPSGDDALERIAREPALRAVAYESGGLGSWDTGLVTLLARIEAAARERQVAVEHRGLPDGARRLLDLAFAVEEREGARRQAVRKGLLTRTGERFVANVASLRESLAFLGAFAQSVGRFVRGRANYQRSDLWVTMQETGAEALPIVGLISFLLGLIFAFVGVMQLDRFGAGIFVADLVALGMVREMGPIMTGIIMAGRTGAAFAARLGTMKVSEEIDALTTLGLDPMDFLVLPRVLALVVMLPLLTLYANLVGILGGMVVALAMLDVSVVQYWVQTQSALDVGSLVTGLIKALVYGVVVALAGCRNGLECGSSAQAVGLATTSAVVSGIVGIIVTASVLTVIYITLGV
ncbi:MAG: ABC transporter permease [Deltaproteobacteria bacterium]|nr:ABC transporter permease [Deltaproteobacteria bacterium]